MVAGGVERNQVRSPGASGRHGSSSVSKLHPLPHEPRPTWEVGGAEHAAHIPLVVGHKPVVIPGGDAPGGSDSTACKRSRWRGSWQQRLQNLGWQILLSKQCTRPSKRSAPERGVGVQQRGSGLKVEQEVCVEACVSRLAFLKPHLLHQETQPSRQGGKHPAGAMHRQARLPTS